MTWQLDHIQLAIPVGGEDRARAFWIDTLGLKEVTKPEPLQDRGGLWLLAGSINIHLGIADPFVPACKAHPCFAVTNLDDVAHQLSAADCKVAWDDILPGIKRFFTADPFGNRVEFMQD
jgi:catechol 2,3-dioxygenase-like lactoylglutathione lyase family enzyme